MPATAIPEVGAAAPDFSLKGPGGQTVSLSEYRGKNVVLAFFPMAFSPPCSHQLPEIEKLLPELAQWDAVVMGISVDNHFANSAFARKLGVSFPLLSDFDRKVSAAYGVLIEEKGYSGRALFVIDKNGKVAHRDVSAVPGDVDQFPSNQRLLDVIRSLS